MQAPSPFGFETAGVILDWMLKYTKPCGFASEMCAKRATRVRPITGSILLRCDDHSDVIHYDDLPDRELINRSEALFKKANERPSVVMMTPVKT